MTNVTEVLGDESGIQYQGVNDASGGNGAYPTIGLMVGQFRRGRLDKPMTVTSQNIRALLGYEPDNFDYVAVQDVLNTGVPSVQVLRLNKDDKGEITPPISCVGASNSIDIHDCILINQVGAIYPEKEQWVVDGLYFENPPNFLSAEQIAPPITPPPVGYEWSTSMRMKNNSNANVRMERIFTPSNQNIIKSTFIGNTTVDESVLGRQAFCLSPKPEQPLISCEGASSQLRFERFVGNWDMEVDGVFYQSSVDDMLQNWITANLSHIMVADYDGFMIFGNLTDTDHRIRFIPKSPTLSVAENPSGNDTYMRHQDGSITVCLKAFTEEVPCNPTSLSLKNNTLGVGGTASLQYRVNAPNFNIDEVQTFERVDNTSDIEMEELLGYWMDHIMGMYDFIHITRSASGGDSNFYLQSVGSPVATSMNLVGFNDFVRSEPISITFIRSGLQGDIFGKLFDGLDNEKVTHSCGVSEIS